MIIGPSLVKLFVSSDEGSRCNDLVPHLFQGIEQVERRSGKLNFAVLLVASLRASCRLLDQHSNLVQREAIHGTAEEEGEQWVCGQSQF
jgi:hypothetical protein